MALIKTSALVSAISGTVGGNVFSRNRGGNYVRKWAKGVASNTPTQAVQRQSLTAVAQFYRSLTNSERKSWANAALEGVHEFKNRLGEVYAPSGYQYFLRMNMIAQTIGVSLLRVPTSPEDTPTFRNLGGGFDTAPIGGQVQLIGFLNAGPEPDGEFSYVIRINRPSSPGKDVKADRILKVIKPEDSGFTYDAVTGQTTFAIPYSQVESKFGAYQAGTPYILSVQAVADAHPWDVLAESMEEGATV